MNPDLRTHLGTLPHDPPRLVGARAQLFEAERLRRCGEHVVAEEAAATQARGTEILETLV